MPRQFHMTYVVSQKGGLTKKYKGSMYSVSCKQLDCSASRDASWAAANSWWEKTQAEIDAQAKAAQKPAHPRSDAIVQAMQENLGLTFDTTEQASQAFMELMLAAYGRGPAPTRLANRGGHRPGEGGGHTAGRPGADGRRHAPTERSVGKQVEQWLTVLRVSVGQKLMDEGRFDAYQRHVRIFERWVGTDTPVDALNAPKLEEWWACLSLKVGEGSLQSILRQDDLHDDETVHLPAG